MLKNVMRANKKRTSEYQQTTDDLVFFSSLVRETFQTKCNPRTPRSPSSGVKGHYPDFSYL